MPAYVNALIEEIDLWGQVVPSYTSVPSIFFGGGTPSLLPLASIEKILEACRNNFALAEDIEISLEANPGDLSPSVLSGQLKAGINRLSIGVQSLNDTFLLALTRRHSSSEAKKAFCLARDAGFTNINLDLMYGLPGQTLDQWAETLDGACDLEPEHLSLYALTLERGTPLFTDVAKGAVESPDPDIAADMYIYTMNLLFREGRTHYEISNWSKPGSECVHNLVYWRNQPYLGLGAGAHSYFGGYRFSDEPNPRRYVKRVTNLSIEDSKRGQQNAVEEMIRASAPLDHIEFINPALEMADTMMLGLRLMDGIGADDFKNRFGHSIGSVYGRELEELQRLELLRFKDGYWQLTPRAYLLSNEVFQKFIAIV